jgi:hypothetical protein
MEMVGRRIVCVEMTDPLYPIPSGTKGTVRLVDGIGQIHVNWDNGRTLPIIPEMDRYRLIEEDTRKCTEPLFWGCNLFYNLKCQGCPKFL